MRHQHRLPREAMASPSLEVSMCQGVAVLEHRRRRLLHASHEPVKSRSWNAWRRDHPVSCSPAALQRALGLQLNFISMHISRQGEKIKNNDFNWKILAKQNEKRTSRFWVPTAHRFVWAGIIQMTWLSPMAFCQPQFPHLPSLGRSDELAHESTHWHPLLNPLPRKLTSLSINLGLLTWAASWRLCGMSCTRLTVHLGISKSFTPLKQDGRCLVHRKKDNGGRRV